MSKTTLFENKAFQSLPPSSGAGFNLIHQVNNFNALFQIKPLDPGEASEIQRLLCDNASPDKVDEVQMQQDVEQLQLLTSEIRAIGKQGIVLMGQRVQRAKELLKPYKDGTFTKWLETAFGTRKTGYNMLAYYELHSALPHDDLRENLKKLPQRTAYILASREGDIETKAHIIREYHDKNKKHDELIVVIQEKLPLSSKDKRTTKSSSNTLIAALARTLEKLQKSKKELTRANKKDLADLSKKMMFLSV